MTVGKALEAANLPYVPLAAKNQMEQEYGPQVIIIAWEACNETLGIMTTPKRERGLFRYRPRGWALASTAVAGLGWFIEIWFQYRHGADTSLGAVFNVFAALFLAIIPLSCGAIMSIRSQRAADIAFSLAMIAQGIGLVVLGVTS